MKLIITIISLMFVCNCQTGSIKEKKVEYGDSKVEFRIGEIVRYNGHDGYYPKDPNMDFVVIPLIASNISQEPIQIMFNQVKISDKSSDTSKTPPAKAEKKDKDSLSLQETTPRFISACCGLGEEQYKGFVKIFTFSTYNIPTIEPKDSVSRTLAFMYPKNQKPVSIKLEYVIVKDKTTINLGPFELKGL
jgi:hypothetical protein